MSDKDLPSSTMGRSDRTIIRPNPGARRRVAPVSAPAAAAPAAAPAVPYPQAAAPSGATEEWIATPAAPKPAEPVQRRPDLRLDELAAPNENPIMHAAGPLL